jgi:hypothetical protein
MKRRAMVAVAAVAGIAALAVVALAGPAQAGPPLQKLHFHDDVTEVEENFCGVPDLSVEIHEVVDGTFKFNTTGKNDVPHLVGTSHGTVSFTNLTTLKSFTNVFNGPDKTLKITNNGDGTATVIQLITGGGKWLGPDGKVVFKDSGQIRLQHVIDFNDTPLDLTDDVTLSTELIKGSTGTNDTEGRDFCEDFLAITG